MEVKASAKYLRISPRKLRQLTFGWIGKPAEKILVELTAQPQRGREFLEKVVKQAIANAKNNFKLRGDLLVRRIEVSEGPASKRMDRSHGARFDRGVIKKRTAHVFLTLTGETEEVPPTKKVALPKMTKTIAKTIESPAKKEKKSRRSLIDKKIKEEKEKLNGQ